MLRRSAPVRAILVPGLLAACLLGLRQAGPPPATSRPPAPAPPPPCALLNNDLAAGEVGREPPGWWLPKPSTEKGYKTTIVADAPGGGGKSARLSAPAAEQSPRGGAGVLMRSCDATPYRGKVVRFRAAVRSEGAGLPQDQAQLWLRIDRPGDQIGFFDNMSNRPIRDKAWRFYEIVGKVAADAATVNLGMILQGSGSASFASPSFEVVGDPLPDEPARPLDSHGLDNLVALTRLLGYVRYFHPSDQAAGADWDRFTLAAVRTVEGASGPVDLARALETLFLPLAPTLRVFPANHPAALPAELRQPPAGVENPRIVTWRHLGLGIGVDNLSGVYKSERVDQHTPDLACEDDQPAATVLPRPDEPLATDLGAGIAALVPLAVYAGPRATLPTVPADLRPREPDAAYIPSGNDRATRLADVALTWTVFQHFYPYFDVVQSDWPAALRRALTSAAADRDETAFLDTLKHLVASARDGHGNAWSAGSDLAALPVLWEWVEDRLVITQVDREHGAGLAPGDEVLAIGGQPVKDRFGVEEELVSGATPQWRRYRVLQRLLLGPAGDVELRVRHISGAAATVKLARSLPAFGPGSMEERRPEKLAEIAPGIFYVDVQRADDGDWNGALDRLSRAKGIVFDFRGYPKLTPAFLQHLVDHPIHSAQWRIPVVTRPDRQGMKFCFSHWTLPPLAPRLTARLAFVTDGRAISYAESCMGIVEAYHLGEIVGTPTAGTNGNINPFSLPGGYHVIFTGMQVRKHDGSRHHGVGILPTIPVSRTVKGVAAGRDELLDKALAVVSR